VQAQLWCGLLIIYSFGCWRPNPYPWPPPTGMQ
jgi:hypothetical protein